MKDIKDPNNRDLKVGDDISGYRIDSITPLGEINAVLYRLEHQAVGAQHVHVSRQDPENTFGVTFKTVPSDSTGVAHILEHTALCGSRKYPVRDPFFSMLKRSLSTFMNAFTASDWTMYPFATQNPKDYRNLMDVYLDAAFFPRLDRLSFKQEGHRLEVTDNGATGNGRNLIYKGVVYNEMKGAMSSPDQVMARSMLNALYPDTTYSNNSGGDPAVIPRLTHEALKAFHQHHYHPSNAFFYSYGNLPLKDHLAFIDERIMAQFTRIAPRTEVPSQSRWKNPQTRRYTYPLAPSENPERKSQVCLAWLLCDIRDTFEVLVLSVLEQILLGNSGSPLRRALMDSGLGSALSDGTGYDADNRDTMFACGLKEVDISSEHQIEKIILDVLGRLIKDGIDRELVDSAIHQIEFHRKEITNYPYPYGIRLLLTVIGSWLHGGHPERVLQLDADLQRLRREIDAGPFIESCIQTYFLENTHRVRMSLVPDQQKSRKEEEHTQRELHELWQRLSEAEKKQIEKDASQLKALQDNEENISCLPTLALKDIPPQIQTYTPSRISSDMALWGYDQPTSGIVYFSGAAGVADIASERLPWIPFFCYLFTRTGTQRYDYSRMARRIDAVTGGIRMAAHARMQYDPSGGCLPMIALNAKCLNRNLDPMVAVIEELIAEADYSNTDRLKQLLGEYQAGLQSMIVQNGHRLAISLSSRAFSPSSALSEIWSGVSQMQTIRRFTRDLDGARLRSLAQTMADIAGAIFQPHNFVMAVIGENATDNAAKRIFSSKTLSAFRHDHQQPELPIREVQMNDKLPHEGWSTSSAVAFVAQTVSAVPMGHPDAPSLAVISKLLRSLYLHREIREKGGAYGGFALYNPENGLFSLASYRDPQISRTLEVYAAAAGFLQKERIGDEDVKEAILQVCSEIDKPDPPGPAARKAFSRLIVGLSDETRRDFKQQLLGVTKDQVLRTAARYLGPDNNAAGVAVIAGQTQLEEANKQLGGRELTLHEI